MKSQLIDDYGYLEITEANGEDLSNLHIKNKDFDKCILKNCNFKNTTFTNVSFLKSNIMILIFLIVPLIIVHSKVVTLIVLNLLDPHSLTVRSKTVT